jgi:hypothetical protein
MTMISLLKKYDIPAGFLALAALMFFTRFHHFGMMLANQFGTTFSLPDASLSVFFFGGLFFNRLKLFAFLIIEAALIDYVAIAHLNVSDYCISAGYIGLIPTYGVMWLGGMYCAKFKTFNKTDMVSQLTVLVLATSAAFFISNISFYLSGRFTDLSLLEYAGRVAQFYLPYLMSTFIYSVLIDVSVKTALHLKQPTFIN